MRRLQETGAFPGADKCNYIDLTNFIRGKEIKFIRYLLHAKKVYCTKRVVWLFGKQWTRDKIHKYTEIELSKNS